MRTYKELPVVPQLSIAQLYEECRNLCAPDVRTFSRGPAFRVVPYSPLTITGTKLCNLVWLKEPSMVAYAVPKPHQDRWWVIARVYLDREASPYENVRRLRLLLTMSLQRLRSFGSTSPTT